MKTNENGRSMIEMLGVLAIIGVLSVGGIYGYTVAMRKYKANEIAQTLSMLATMAHAGNAGLGDNVTLADSGLTVNPAGVDMTGTTTTCVDGNATATTSDCPYVKVDINGATGLNGDLKAAVCAIVPTAAPNAATAADATKRAGYYVVTCS